MLIKDIIFSERLNSIATAKSMDIAEKARTLMAVGKDIIDFSWGEPDFDTPPNVKEACKRALDKNLTHYSASRGIEGLRKAVCDKANRMYGLKYAWDKNVIITPGAKQAIFYSLFSLLNRGDEVLVPEPYWLSYKDAVGLAGGTFKTVPCLPENGFRLRASDLERRISAKTKIVLLNNPCNPTGVLLDKGELQSIAEVIKKTDAIVISDEIYSGLVFDGKDFTTFASLDDMFERTITINGFSKTYAMTGWRLGYILAEKVFIDAINKVHQHIATCAGTFTQYAAGDALKYCDNDVEGMRGEYEERRDLIVDLIKGLKNISCVRPDGTFYCWVDIKKTGHTSASFSNLLLDEAGIASVPGTAYGESGEGYVRFAFTQPKDRIREGIERMKGLIR